MAKRQRNWVPDVYDMARPRKVAPLDTDSGDEELPVETRRVKPSPMAVNMGRFRTADNYLPAGAEDMDLQAADGEDSDMPVETVVVRVPVKAPAPARQSDNTTLLGLVVGALVGAGLTLLVTPASGAQLRQRLQTGAQGAADTARASAQGVAQKMPNITASSGDTSAAGEHTKP